MVESGCVFASNIISGLANGDIDWETAFKETAAVYGAEFAMNLFMGLAMDMGGSTVKTSVELDANDVHRSELETSFNAPESSAYLESNVTSSVTSTVYNSDLPSYKNLESFCSEYGITVEEYVKMSQTRLYDLDVDQKRIVWEIRKKIGEPYIDVETGYLKEGTFVAKSITESDFNAYYSDGKIASVGG